MPACVCIASTSRSRWSQLSLNPLLLPLRRFLGPSGRITAYHGTSGWLAMLELKRRSGSRSPFSGFQTAWPLFSTWPSPNASSASREPPPSSEKPASPSSFSCLLCLIAPHIHAPFSLVPFHPSISLHADLLPILQRCSKRLSPSKIWVADSKRPVSQSILSHGSMFLRTAIVELTGDLENR